MTDDQRNDDDWLHRDPEFQATAEHPVVPPEPDEEARRDESEFGPSPFAPPPPPAEETSGVVRIVSSDEPPLRFGAGDTGPLPHWTEPPTGEVPKVLLDESSDDLAAWTSLGGQQPVWRDDRSGAIPHDELDFESLAEGTRVGALDENAPPDVPFFEEFEEPEPTGHLTGETPRVTPIRTRGTRSATTAAPRGRADEAGFTTTRGTGGRNMPLAVAAGLAIAAVAVLLFMFGARYVMVLVVAVVVLAGIELYEKLRERGYQPATLAGLAAIAGLPLAAYWRGESALALVLFLAIAATLVWFILSGGLESGPLPNTAVTMLGVVYVGLLGSYGALLLRLPDGVSLLLVTAIGVVAYDVGGLFVGSAAGRTQLVPWISPNKTVEGLVGGVVAVLLAVLLATMVGFAAQYEDLLDAVKLAAVIMVTAPLGDLAASMLKRNLDVKDFGTLLPGHGGVLDRFCSFLLVLPAVYYLTTTIF